MIVCVLILLLLVFQIRTWVYLRKMRQHDRVLFQFCDFRRELMGFMRTDQAYKLGPKSYAAFRDLLDTTNITVHNFHILKPAFNFRRMMRMMRDMMAQMSEQEKQVARISVLDERVEYFTARMISCWATAFFAYTPFLRHQLLLTLLHRVASVLKAAGVRRLARLVDEIRTMANEAEQVLTSSRFSTPPYRPA